MNNRPFFATLSTGVLLALAASCSHAQQIRKFPVTPLNAGIHVIQAEVASTEAERERGLMYRKQMAANEGMVFVFEAPVETCMWMKNTFLPLSVAFLDAAGNIVNIEDMQPQTLDSHCSKKSVMVRYALEMNLGWFKQKNIKPGTMIEGLPRLR